jgi:hypothetical protein
MTKPAAPTCKLPASAPTHVTDKPPDKRSLFAFKLHQFISGGGKVFTPRSRPPASVPHARRQQFVPGDRAASSTTVHFCRDCGQEYIPVWDSDGSAGPQVLQPRNIDDRQHEDEEVKFGFFMPDTEAIWEDTARPLPGNVARRAR